MKLPLFLMVFVNVHIYFRIWTRIRIPRVTDPVPDPAKVPDPCGSGSVSGSTTLVKTASELPVYDTDSSFSPASDSR
jgi:hypothetical protein